MNPAAAQQDHVVRLRAEIAAMRAKIERIRESITIRETKLNRLQARAILDGCDVAAHPRHGN